MSVDGELQHRISERVSEAHTLMEYGKTTEEEIAESKMLIKELDDHFRGRIKQIGLPTIKQTWGKIENVPELQELIQQSKQLHAAIASGLKKLTKIGTRLNSVNAELLELKHELKERDLGRVSLRRVDSHEPSESPKQAKKCPNCGLPPPPREEHDLD